MTARSQDARLPPGQRRCGLAGGGSGGGGASGWADAPPDLLRAILQAAQDLPAFHNAPTDPPMKRVLALTGLVSAAAVCRSWWAALSDSPDLESLTIGSGSTGKCAWVRRARPAPRSLRIHCSAASEAGQEMLRCVQGTAVEEAEVGAAPRCLPDPRTLPNLWLLTVNALDFDARWVRRLGTLQGLQVLELSVNKVGPPRWLGDNEHADARHEQPLPQYPTLELPTLASLRSLKVFLARGAPTLRVDLSLLPELQELEVWGNQQEGSADRGVLQLTGRGSKKEEGRRPGEPRNKMRSLSLDVAEAEVDFGGLPALRTAELWVGREFRGAGTLASAPRLRRLRLGSPGGCQGGTVPDWENPLDAPLVLAALRTLPPALRVLCLKGQYLQVEAAAALAGAGTLRALAIDFDSEFETYEVDADPAEIPPGPLWSSLRALRWDSWQPLPKALASADSLEVLACYCPCPGPEELALLASLPELRELRIQTRGAQPAGFPQQLREYLAGALPGVQTLAVFPGGLDCMRNEECFLEAAQGLIAGE